MTQSAMLILHGKQATNDLVRRAVMKQRKAGRDLAVRVTWEGGDAERYVREALQSGYQTLIAGGGDGSVRDITDALLRYGEQPACGDGRRSDGPDLRLAILPLGTANDFATAAGIPDDPVKALALLDQPARPVDVVSVNGHHFLNMATGGFGTEVTSQTSEDLKKMLGGAAYLLTGLTRFSEIRAAKGRLRGPNFDWRGEFLALGLGNGRQAGGGQPLCPEALINDGLLDVAILPAQLDLLAGVRELFDNDAHQARKEGLFVRARVSELEIETPEPMNLNLDGEPLESRHFHLKVVTGRLALHLPDNSCLLSD